MAGRSIAGVFLGVLTGELLDAFQGEETTAKVVHAQRSEEAREVDNREFAERQTHDIQEWLEAPDKVDFGTVDNPAFHRGQYEPWAEFDHDPGDWDGLFAELRKYEREP